MSPGQRSGPRPGMANPKAKVRLVYTSFVYDLKTRFVTVVFSEVLELYCLSHRIQGLGHLKFIMGNDRP